MKKSAIVLLMVLAGCATNTTTQKDISYEEGKVARQIVTTTKAKTFWEANSKLADFSATQTDKTQSTKIGSVSNQSTSTNVTSQLQALVEILRMLNQAP